MFSETGQPGESPEARRKSRGTDDRGSRGTEKLGSHPATPEESTQAEENRDWAKPQEQGG